MRTIHVGWVAFLAWGCGSVVHDDPDGADAEGGIEDAAVEDGGGEDAARDDGGPETADCSEDIDCSDGNPCNGEERCQAGRCEAGTPPSDGTSCDDEDACTEGDSCRAGVCEPGASVCACRTTPDCAAFEDGDLCNGTLVCHGGFCVVDPETLVTCRPPMERMCEAFGCIPATGACEYRPTPGVSCNDGNACSVGDTCNDSGICVGAGVLPGTDCGGECVDTSSDPEHCGSCTTPCARDMICRDSVCLPRSWEPVNGVVNPVALASAHALAVGGGTPTVAWTTAASTRSLWVYRPILSGWSSFGAGSASPVATAVQPVVDLAFHGDAPYVAFADTTVTGMGPAVRVRRAETVGWRDVGGPGWTSPCLMLSSLSLALEADRPHVAILGSGGCGIGVGYGRWTGTTWWSTPDPPAPMPGLITDSGGGCTDVAFDGTAARVAMMDTDDRFVRSWMPGSPGSWVNLGGVLDFGFRDTTGGGFLSDQLALAADNTGTLWFAWSEVYEVSGIDIRGVFVRRWNSGLRSWTLLGAGKINDGLMGEDPHVALVGGIPHVVYREATVAWVWRVFVKRWNGSAWEAVGGSLNVEPVVGAADPQIADVAGVPHVAFRQPPGSDGGRIHVLRWPW